MHRRSLLVCVLLAGCGSDGAGPEDRFSIADFEAGLSALAEDMESNAPLRSLQASWIHLPNLSVSARGAAARTFGPTPVLGFGPRLRAVLAHETGVVSPKALILGQYLGRTFEWDVVNDAYVVGSAPGAPPSGVRVVLYLPEFPDSFISLPKEPLVTVGRLDVSDVSTVSENRLSFLLTAGALTLGRYSIAGAQVPSPSPTGYSFAASESGSLYDGTGARRNTFDAYWSFTGDFIDANNYSFSGASETHFQASNGLVMDVSIEWTGSNSGFAETLEVLIEGRTGVLEFVRVILNDLFEVEVSYDDVLVARLVGTPGSETVEGVGDRELGLAERQAILESWRAFYAAFQTTAASSNGAGLVIWP